MPSQDLIAAEGSKLDWLFRFSFIKDVLNGLIAITSVLACHGRLKSTCCFVDSHFVARIADYGLPSFFARTTTGSYDSVFCTGLLWTAPELLERPFDGGTQEGDVFSLAIVLQELTMGEAPYVSYYMDPEGILLPESTDVDMRNWYFGYMFQGHFL